MKISLINLNKLRLTIFSTVACLTIGFLFFPIFTDTYQPQHKVLGEKITAIQRGTGYPKIANYYLSSNQNFDYQKLASYDLVILPVDTQIYNREFFIYAREYNPDIIILAYTPSQSINTGSLNDPRSFNYQLNSQIKNNWWLKDSHGNQVYAWPNIKTINLSTEWSNWFPEFVQTYVLSTGLWDGVFYDMTDKTVSWVNNGDLDLDNNGVKDENNYANSLWSNGFNNLLKKSRATFGEHKIILLNGAIDESWLSYVNGVMFENFPTPWLGNSWSNSLNLIKKYQALTVSGRQFFIINSLGVDGDYQKNRFHLLSALLENVYFSSDQSIEHHEDLHWYDEYNINLGTPINQSYNLLKNSSTYTNGVWRRDFTNGLILINSTSQNQTIDLSDGLYEKIKGQQDSNINNGQIVNKITLKPTDAIILYHKLETVNINSFVNGAFIRVFNNKSQLKRAGFYAYDSATLGSEEIIKANLDNDSDQEKIITRKNEVRILKANGQIIASFYPYGQNYQKSIHVALGDVNGDGQSEIITGAGNGGGPHVRIFNLQGQLLSSGFFAFDKNSRGGVNVALGDVNGDGQSEIITGAGTTLEPYVKIFNYQGKLLKSFLVYDKKFQGGVNVASADLNLDGASEIITGAGIGGGPHIRIFNGMGTNLGQDFFAFDKNKRQGVRVYAQDVDGDGQIEILGMN